MARHVHHKHTTAEDHTPMAFHSGYDREGHPTATHTFRMRQSTYERLHAYSYAHPGTKMQNIVTRAFDEFLDREEHSTEELDTPQHHVPQWLTDYVDQRVHAYIEGQADKYMGTSKRTKPRRQTWDNNDIDDMYCSGG